MCTESHHMINRCSLSIPEGYHQRSLAIRRFSATVYLSQKIKPLHNVGDVHETAWQIWLPPQPFAWLRWLQPKIYE